MLRAIAIVALNGIGTLVRGFVDDINEIKIKLNRFETKFRKFEEQYKTAYEQRLREAKKYRGVKP